jgi:branched-chain amino acid transport system permease protein
MRVGLKLALELLGFLALAALVAVLPRLVGDFTVYEFAIVGMYFIALLGLAILTGYSGQISLGHGAFMAIGGYTTAILTVDGIYGHEIRDLWTIPIAGVVAGLAGLLVGVPALRLSGLYLALITFGIAVSFPQLPKKFDHFLGGTTGKVMNLVKAPFGLDTTPNRWLYYLTWGIALVLLAAAWALLRGRPGRALQAIRDSEVAAASSGVNLATYKTLAFGISAFYAGVAGSLYAISKAYMNPDIFPIILSVYLVAALAVGGLNSLLGLIAGAALIYVLQNRADDVTRWLNHLPVLDLDPKQPGMPSVVFGIVLIVVMLALPTGAGGLLRRLFGPLTTRLYSKS